MIETTLNGTGEGNVVDGGGEVEGFRLLLEDNYQAAKVTE